MKYGSSIFPGPLLFGTVFIYDIIITALFLIICYSISRSWLFPILWGFITILGAFTIRLIVQLIESRVLDVSPLLQVNIIINIFLYGFLFATAIIFSVHLMGIKYWSLILGISTANLLSTYFNFLVDKTSPGLEQIGSDIFDGILFGLCIYIGLYFHKQRTRLRAAASPGAPR
jgi:hypothetical protein